MEELEIKIEVLVQLIKENTKALKSVQIKLFNQENRIKELIEKLNITNVEKCCQNCKWKELLPADLPCRGCENSDKWEEKEE